VLATELALSESEKSYRTIIETVSDVIFRLGPDQRIEFINPAIRFFGFDPDELIGHSIDKFIAVSSDNPELISKIATRGVGPLSTSHLEVNIQVVRDTVPGENARPIPVLLDAFGLWDASDKKVFKKEGGYRLAEQLRQQVIDLKLEHENNICGSEVTISLGVATGTAEPGKQFSDLLSQADKVLYAAKNSGRNQTSFFEEG
jgi:GGDEF domain-containing protein